MNFARYRVTAGGGIFGAALAAAGAAAFVTANNLLFLIFAAMLALLVVSGFLNRLVLSGLELELLLPEHVAARDVTPARVRLRNLKHFAGSYSIELSAGGGGAALARPVYFPVVPGGGWVEAGVEMVFARRGRHGESVFVLATRFPFGFIQRAAQVELKRETVVYPAIGRGVGVGELVARVEELAEARRRAVGQDFYRIRPYVSGDGARQVDWKSTAHTGELQVREFARDERRSARIYFDRFAGAGAEAAAAFERVLEECASAVWALTEEGFEIEFASQGCESREPFAILRFLALAERSEVAGGDCGDAVVFRA